MAGALLGRPIELVKAETVDLEVPANAEIVIEGEISTQEMVEEGPFGEHTGYHAGARTMKPVINVKAVTYRDEPILRGAMECKPPDEGHFVASVSLPALIRKELKGVIPGILDVYTPVSGDPWLSAVVQIRQFYAGHARDVAHAILGSDIGRYFKMVIIVDDDINPFDINEVWWALTTRVHPGRDIEITKYRRSTTSDPSLMRGELLVDKMVVDATKKLHYPFISDWNSTWPPVAVPPVEVQELVEMKWSYDVPKGDQMRRY